MEANRQVSDLIVWFKAMALKRHWRAIIPNVGNMSCHLQPCSFHKNSRRGDWAMDENLVPDLLEPPAVSIPERSVEISGLAQDGYETDLDDALEAERPLRGFKRRWRVRKRLRSSSLSPSPLPSPSPLQELYDPGEDDEPEAVPGPKASAADHVASVNHAFLTGMNTAVQTLPWEQAWLSPIFGETFPSAQLGMPINWNETFSKPESDLLPGSAPVIEQVVPFSMARCVMNKVDRSFIDDREVQSRRAISKLKFFLGLVQGQCEVSLQLDAEFEEQAQNDMLSAIIGTRSPTTTIKRINSLLSFYRWHSINSEDEFAPFQEASAWAYVRSLCDTNAAPTKASSFVQALRYAQHVLQVKGAADCTASRRIIGSAEIQLSKKSPTKQARPLTVVEVRMLHMITQDTKLDIQQRTIASHLLMMLYTRSRNSDLAHVHEVLHDGRAPEEKTTGLNYIQISTRYHKSARTAEKKNLLLPILASSVGVSDDDWLMTWIKLRKQAGLQVAGTFDCALQPAPDTRKEGQWLTRPLACAETTLILRAMVQSDSKDLTSHSLKVTGLSWAAKAEIDRDMRRLLGRHSSSLRDADSIYARDLAFAPVQAFSRMLTLIKDNQFQPDLPREMFFKETNPLVPGTPLPIFQPRTPVMQGQVQCSGPTDLQPEDGWDTSLVKDESLSDTLEPIQEGPIEIASESESTTSTSGQEWIESSDDHDTRDDNGVAPNPLEQVMDALVRNNKTKTVHSIPDIGHLVTSSVYANGELLQSATTKCGRTTQSGFTIIERVTDWTSKCRICFRGNRQPENLFGQDRQ